MPADETRAPHVETAPDAEVPSTYTVCGLRLRSALPLPGLATAEGEAGVDVTVTRRAVDAPERWPASGIAAWPSPEADVLSWAGRARLRVSASEIAVDSSDDRFARQCVVGPGLGVLLHRRGRLVLHGSAVDVGGKAIVLLGEKGAGKSTTAAAFLARGHALLTDDLVAVSGRSGTPTALPGPTQMKLWPESADALGLSGEAQPFLDGLTKGVWHGARAAERVVPIALVCALTWGDPLTLDQLSGQTAFGAVAAHAYAPRFLGAPAAASLVGPCAALVGAVPVARLTRPQDLDGLGRAIDLLEETAGWRAE